MISISVNPSAHNTFTITMSDCMKPTHGPAISCHRQKAECCLWWDTSDNLYWDLILTQPRYLSGEFNGTNASSMASGAAAEKTKESHPYVSTYSGLYDPSQALNEPGLVLDVWEVPSKAAKAQCSMSSRIQLQTEFLQHSARHLRENSSASYREVSTAPSFLRDATSPRKSNASNLYQGLDNPNARMNFQPSWNISIEEYEKPDAMCEQVQGAELLNGKLNQAKLSPLLSLSSRANTPFTPSQAFYIIPEPQTYPLVLTQFSPSKRATICPIYSQPNATNPLLRPNPNPQRPRQRQRQQVRHPSPNQPKRHPKPRFIPPRKWSQSRLQALMRRDRPRNLPSSINWPSTTDEVTGLTTADLNPVWTCVDAPFLGERRIESAATVTATAERGSEVQMMVGSRIALPSDRQQNGSWDMDLDVHDRGTFQVPFRVVVTNEEGSVVWDLSWFWSGEMGHRIIRIGESGIGIGYGSTSV